MLLGPPEAFVLLHCQAVGLLTDAISFAASHDSAASPGADSTGAGGGAQLERLCESLLSSKQRDRAMWQLMVAANQGFGHADFAAAQQGTGAAPQAYKGTRVVHRL